MSEVTVSTEPESSGSEATALAAGAAAANAAHAQATADEALETARAASEASVVAMQTASPGLTAEEVRAIVRDHLASVATPIETPTDLPEPEAEVVSVVESAPPESEAPNGGHEPSRRRGHPMMRLFLGRTS